MKKFFCIFSLLISLFITGCNKNENELVLVTEAGFAPYEYYEDGEIVGVDIEIAKIIASRLNKELVIKDVSFDFLINEVKSGKADFAAAGISITDERKKEVDFTKEYTISNQVVVVKKNSQLKSFDESAPLISSTFTPAFAANEATNSGKEFNTSSAFSATSAALTFWSIFSSSVSITTFSTTPS